MSEETGKKIKITGPMVEQLDKGHSPPEFPSLLQKLSKAIRSFAAPKEPTP
jgi:hypothetical protein